MKTIRLDSGLDAPEMEDRIRITMAGPRSFRWGGSVAYRKEVVFKDCPDYYETCDLAESDALEWAKAHGVETLYIEIDDA